MLFLGDVDLHPTPPYRRGTRNMSEMDRGVGVRTTLPSSVHSTLRPTLTRRLSEDDSGGMGLPILPAGVELANLDFCSRRRAWQGEIRLLGPSRVSGLSIETHLFRQGARRAHKPNWALYVAVRLRLFGAGERGRGGGAKFLEILARSSSWALPGNPPLATCTARANSTYFFLYVGTQRGEIGRAEPRGRRIILLGSWVLRAGWSWISSRIWEVDVVWWT